MSQAHKSPFAAKGKVRTESPLALGLVESAASLDAGVRGIGDVVLEPA
jgi:hypothetical protein